MELRDYWRVFRRRAWIPVLLAAAAVVAATVLAFFSRPTYTATATVIAKGSSSRFSTDMGITPVVSFPQAATSNSVAVEVIQKLGLKESVDHLLSRIRVASLGDNLYRITITDPSPDSASSVANEVARQGAARYLRLGTQTTTTAVDEGLANARDDLLKQYATASNARLTFSVQHPNALTSKDVAIAFQALQLQLEEESAAGAYRGILDQIIRGRINRIAAATGFDARVVDPAVARLDASGRPIEIVSAGLLALVVGTMLVFLLEYLDTTIREPDGVEEMIGAPVIGVIPHANPHSLRANRGGA